MSENIFNYINNDSKIYKIIIGTTKNDELYLNIIESSNQIKYTSTYNLNNINEAFLNIMKFKGIQDYKSCLINNINRKALEIKFINNNYIKTKWKLLSNDGYKSTTFTLKLQNLSLNQKINLYCFSDYYKINILLEEIKIQLSTEIDKASLNSQNNNFNKFKFKENMFLDSIYCLKGNYSNENEKENDFLNLLKLNQNEMGPRQMLIFFDEENIINFMIKVIKKFYSEQIFILFFTEKNIESIRLEINSKLYKLRQTYLPYFDENNIFIRENSLAGYKCAIIPLIKVYCYFNQLGDDFYKQLINKKYNILGLEEQIQNLSLTHYFNILLYGRTRTGKSTFINKIMGEKKAFISRAKEVGTTRDNFYIHKKFPIKIIDLSGLCEGYEIEDNLEKLKSIYSKEDSNIIIDESTNDVFKYYEDKRNNIHLLIYFLIYNDRYDIHPQELPFMNEIRKENIPIIFVVNKCPDDIFNDEEEKKNLEDEIKSAMEYTNFENYKIYFINCINRNGFEELLKGIFNNFEKFIIEDNNVLRSIKDHSMPLENLQNLFNHSFFLRGISPEDIILLNSNMIKKNKYSFYYDFFYQLCLSYNKAIKGFLQIIEDMKKKENHLNDIIEPSLKQKLKMLIALERKLNKFIDY